MQKNIFLRNSLPSFVALVCAKSLTLWFFQCFLLILVLAPQFYPRCIASKERKTERESESWLERHVWWMSIQTPPPKKNVNYEINKSKDRHLRMCRRRMQACAVAFAAQTHCQSNITTRSRVPESRSQACVEFWLHPQSGGRPASVRLSGEAE